MAKKTRRSEERAETGPVVILFADVAGSTGLIQRLGDVAAREVIRECERLARAALRSHAGTEVKTLGDGLLATFGSATAAVECAVELQRAVTAWAKGQPEAVGLRIGINAGEPVREDGDVYGLAVNVASRVAGEAAAGEIVVSGVVRELASGRPFVFEDRGETALRGLERPVRLFSVVWREGDEAQPPAPAPETRVSLPPTPFVGREAEIAELLEMLGGESCRLVTLLGPGGAGKTRLAIEAAGRWSEAAGVDAAFVPLETLAGPESIPAPAARQDARGPRATAGAGQLRVGDRRCARDRGTGGGRVRGEAAGHVTGGAEPAE
jgi:class 3 adenylate cyclase